MPTISPSSPHPIRSNPPPPSVQHATDFTIISSRAEPRCHGHHDVHAESGGRPSLLRVQEREETRGSLADGRLVTCIQVRSGSESARDGAGVAVLQEFSQCYREIVGQEPIVAG